MDRWSPLEMLACKTMQDPVATDTTTQGQRKGEGWGGAGGEAGRCPEVSWTLQPTSPGSWLYTPKLKQHGVLVTVGSADRRFKIIAKIIANSH